MTAKEKLIRDVPELDEAAAATAQIVVLKEPEPEGVDATVVVTSISSAEGFEAPREEDLVAPPLMWSEARSTLHLGLLNGKVSAEL